MNIHKGRRNLSAGHPFGLRLHKHLSRRRGLSQRALAESIGVDPSVIARMCKGEFPSTMELLSERVCKIVNFLDDAKVIDSQDEANGFYTDVGLLPPKLQAQNNAFVVDNNEKIIIEVMIRGEISNFNDKNKETIINVISAILQVKQEEVKILRVEEGSVKLTIELPKSVLEKLSNITYDNQKILDELGIITISDHRKHYFNNKIFWLRRRRMYRDSYGTGSGGMHYVISNSISPDKPKKNVIAPRMTDIMVLRSDNEELAEFMRVLIENISISQFKSAKGLIMMLNWRESVGLEGFGKFDIVLWDITSIIDDNDRITEEMRILRGYRDFKNARIIAISKNAGYKEFRQMYEAGFDGFLSDPLSSRMFPYYIERILYGHMIWDIHEF